MSTTIGTVKEAIKDRLQADTDFTGIQISRGSVFPTKTEGEYIEIGNVRPAEGEQHAGLGADSKNENYIIELHISVVRSIHELYETVEDRALVLYGHLWDSLIAWRTEASPYNGLNGWLGITGLATEELFVTDPGPPEVVKERECRLTVSVEVTARI